MHDTYEEQNLIQGYKRNHIIIQNGGFNGPMVYIQYSFYQHNVIFIFNKIKGICVKFDLKYMQE